MGRQTAQTPGVIATDERGMAASRMKGREKRRPRRGGDAAK